MDKGKMLCTTLPSQLVVGRRAGRGLMGVGELVLPLTSCCTQDSGPTTSPGQQSRAGTVGVGAIELISRA